MHSNPKEVLSFSETAETLGLAPRSWSRHWKGYVATRGFPAPIAAPGRSRRRPTWSRVAVVAWIRNGGEAPSNFEAALDHYVEVRRAA